MSELHDLDEPGEPMAQLPAPFDDPLFDLLLLFVLLVIAIGGGLKRTITTKPAPLPTIRLGAPAFAPLAAQDEADAAQLLGSRLAELLSAGGEPTP